MRVLGWVWKLIRALLRDEGTDSRSGGGNLARRNAYGNQPVRAGSLVRLTAGEWKGEEAIVDSVRTNGDMDVTLKRLGRQVRTGRNKVEVLTRSSTPNQTAIRKDMRVRVNRGEWRGRVATVTEVHSNGQVWARITGGSTDTNSDPDSLRGREIKVWSSDVELIGR